MSLVPLGFHGDSVFALVVGCGRVGTRRTVALLEAGAQVRVISPTISAEIEERRGR
ncbi:MAG: NAD(P)-dependent oxidoreductase, partial [Gemmatimonadales bacterium]